MSVLIVIVGLLLLALWTGGALLFVALLQAAGSLLGDGAAVDWAALVTSWSLPSWVVPWVDTAWLQAVQMTMVELLDGVQGSWPALGRAIVDWGVPLVWTLWAIGTLMLLGLGWGLHRLVRRVPAPVITGPVAAGR